MNESIFPKFDLNSAKSALVVQAHPDDAEIGAGGTIAKLAARGVEINYLTVTDGRAGTHTRTVYPEQLVPIRRAEEQAAMKVLGAKNAYWLDVRDGELEPSISVRGGIMRVIRTLKPEVVITLDPWLPYEAHPDHRHAGMMASEAALLSQWPYVHSEHYSEGLQSTKVQAIAFMITSKPNTFIDVTDTFDKKLSAVKCHWSQFGDSWSNFSQLLRVQAERDAKRAGMSGGLAEALKVLSTAQLHVNQNAEYE